jgi:16S rRNA (cytidine1402-2'-O)-methyltransferase
MEHTVKSGTLYIVATPIGHLGDLSPRAQSVLTEVTKIAAEDTRHSQGLLHHLGIRTPMVALHEHNEVQQANILVDELRAGSSIALISDAGTPGISDPGARFVRLAHEAQIPVQSVPGPSALTAAVAASGFSALPIQFFGFLPPKPRARQSVLETLRSAPGTLVFYEAPHRILECLHDLAEQFPSHRHLCIAREISKRFETIRRGSLPDMLAWTQGDLDQQKGEFVLVVEGASEEEALAEQRERGLRLAKELSHHLSVSDSARWAAELSGAKRKELYEELLHYTESDT